MKKIAVILSALTSLAACAGKQEAAPAAQPQPATQTQAQANLPPGLYAVFHTAKGDITAKLYEDKAPKTVKNFTELAEGKKEWTDPRTGQKKTDRFYDGLTFMRTIPGFMIQGGDPLNNTTGGPGYTFEDEFSPELKFDKPGVLAMANAGPNTNGSQFFITDNPTPYGYGMPEHLNGKHTIFGQVISGMDVVSDIADDPSNEGMAVTPVKIDKVSIVRF